MYLSISSAPSGSDSEDSQIEPEELLESLVCHALTFARAHALLGVAATMPVWPIVMSFVINITCIYYWRVGPSGNAGYLPMISEAAVDMPQRLLWSIGYVTGAFALCCCNLLVRELVASQLRSFDAQGEFPKLNRRFDLSFLGIAVGWLLLGCFPWKMGQRNIMHDVGAVFALGFGPLQAKASADMYEYSASNGALLTKDHALVHTLGLRRYWMFACVLVSVIAWIVLKLSPYPEHPFPFDPRTHPRALLEYVWVLGMYVQCASYAVDCYVASKTWRPTMPDADCLTTIHSAAIGPFICVFFAWWLPFLCAWLFVVSEDFLGNASQQTRS